jgi:ankyrin repeat protein
MSRTPLAHAARNGHVGVVRLLRTSRDAVARLPLSNAAESGHAEVMRLLLDSRDIAAEIKIFLRPNTMNDHGAVVRVLVDHTDRCASYTGYCML